MGLTKIRRSLKEPDSNLSVFILLFLCSGYSDSFTWAGPYEDKSTTDKYGRRVTTLVAMDAIQLRDPSVQFEMHKIDRCVFLYCCAMGSLRTALIWARSVDSGRIFRKRRGEKIGISGQRRLWFCLQRSHRVRVDESLLGS